MLETLYQVWINDDNDCDLEYTKQSLQDRFPGALEIRTHSFYAQLQRTVSAYRNERSQKSESEPIAPPDLVIQDYNYGYPHEKASEACLDSLRLITENFPSAKIVIATTEEYFGEAKAVLQKNGWPFPVTGKIYLDDGSMSLVEKIISGDLRQ